MLHNVEKKIACKLQLLINSIMFLYESLYTNPIKIPLLILQLFH